MITDTTWIQPYVARRELIVVIGYRWHEQDRVWRKGKKSLTDEQVDRIGIERMQAYVQKQAQRRAS